MTRPAGSPAPSFAAEPDREALAAFLRAKRERLSPAALGIPVSPRRRARGLLREEIAHEARISVSWYTWLEQARDDVNPSPEVLLGIARALRLDLAERIHLFRLARPDLKPPAALHADEGLVRLVRGLSPHPAYALDPRWNVLTANAPAIWLLGPFDGEPLRRNVLVRMFLDPAWRERMVDWSTVARSAVAQFRAATAGLGLDPEVERLVGELERRSETFAAWWHAQEVCLPPTWRKTLDHPEAGHLVYDYASLRYDAQTALTVYTPADDATRLATRELGPGVQRLPGARTAE